MVLLLTLASGKYKIVPLEPGQRPEDVETTNDAVFSDLLNSRADAERQIARNPTGKLM